MTRGGAPAVDDIFGVLAHPLRRQMLERLAVADSRVSDLAAGLPVSRPAVSQHLRLMLEVGAVSERQEGRERYYSLRRDQLDEVVRWLGRLDDFWARGLRRLGSQLEARS